MRGQKQRRLSGRREGGKEVGRENDGRGDEGRIGESRIRGWGQEKGGMKGGNQRDVYYREQEDVQ